MVRLGGRGRGRFRRSLRYDEGMRRAAKWGSSVAVLGLAAGVVVACSSSSSPDGAGPGGGTAPDGAPLSGDGGGSSSGDGGGGGDGSGGGGDGSGGGGDSGGVGGACLGSKILEDLGIPHVLAGASMDDPIATQAPFDVRYIYLSSGFADGAGPCASCATGCLTKGVSCANPNPCGWWGCWQYDQVPPGQYLKDFVTKAQGLKQVPMVTYYQLLQGSGVTEGAPEVTTAAKDATFMARYWNDWRFVLQTVGANAAILHIEPDFWGYAEQLSEDPHSLPAAVASANATDCGAMENSIAGMARCMIAMTRKYAPKAKVGLHASTWGTKTPALSNTDATFDLAADAAKLGAFLVACGATDGDFIALDASDRDAGYYQSIGKSTFWDDTNAKLPNFTQAFTWSKALAEKVGLGILWWQLPVGNMSQTNVTDHWKDNRVDYFFAHTADLAASHAIGMAFGAGAGGQTTPTTDGGNLVAKVKAYAGGQKYCP
jgi:hypothetical protein